VHAPKQYFGDLPRWPRQRQRVPPHRALIVATPRIDARYFAPATAANNLVVADAAVKLLWNSGAGGKPGAANDAQASGGLDKTASLTPHSRFISFHGPE